MKMDRLISIIMLLLERKTVSATELAGTFGVSTRTIYRDIDTIGQAGIPVVSYPGQNGGVGIMEQYKVDKRLFTASDIASLLIGLGGINSALSGEEIAHTLAKVRGMIPPEQLSEIEFQAGQIAIDLTPWAKDTRLKEMMELVRAALAEKRTLCFDYTNAGGTASSREVEPYRLLYKGNGWYLQGYCLLRNEFRTFRFYRMDGLQLTDSSFAPRRFEPSVFEKNSDGHSSMVEVELHFGEEAKWQIAQVYGNDAIVSREGGLYCARVLAFDNEQGYDMLMLHGDRCEIVSPPHVRAYIVKKAAAIALKHGAGLMAYADSACALPIRD